MSGGFGSGGMGSVGYGFGSVSAANSSTAKLLKKLDGSQGDAALLDTVSGDYVLDDAGNRVGDDSLNQRVYLAMRTVLGSAAVTTMGIDLPSGVITDDIATRNRNAVATALKKLTDQKLIELVNVITNRFATSGVKLEVKWRRLSTGQIETTFV